MRGPNEKQTQTRKPFLSVHEDQKKTNHIPKINTDNTPWRTNTSLQRAAIFSYKAETQNANHLRCKMLLLHSMHFQISP